MTHPYAQIAGDCARAGGAAWLSGALAKLEAPATTALLTAYTGARRILGDAPIVLSATHRAALAAARIDAPLGWSCDEVGRAALLLKALSILPSASHSDLVHSLYHRGDTAERRALLRALSALPDPARFLDTAIEACRTNLVPVFEAIACENPYPERHFPDPAYNQMILKALFLEVPLERVRGLEHRAQPELARMARDYAAERQAAGRSVPEDIARIPGCADIRSHCPREAP